MSSHVETAKIKAEIEKLESAFQSSTRTAIVPSREKLGADRLHCWAIRSLQSGLSGNNREIGALFVYLGAKRAEFVCT